MNQDAQYRVFFVCGPPKAGTTWVQHILDAHPKISCSGEGHFHTKVGKPFVAAMCEYRGLPLQLDRSLLELAWSNLFAH